MICRVAAVVVAFVCSVGRAENVPQAGAAPQRFSFAAQGRDGFTGVQATDTYGGEHAYGFDLGCRVSFTDGGVTSDGPLFFSTRLPAGAYAVTVTLGGGGMPSVTKVKSETRRLMVESLATAPHQLRTETFLVHTRVPTIPGGGRVSLKPREREPVLFIQWGEKQQTFTELDWDDKLTLEFSGEHPLVNAIEIAPAAEHTTVFLVGDSTVTDQMMEPWAAWGQMLPRWFKSPVLVANYAESGETCASFIREHRWEKVLSELRAGDYVFIQFGINDRGMPIEKFKATFEQFIRDVRGKEAFPVLVTSQNLKKLDESGHGVNTLGEYPDAMRQVAGAEKIPLIDLNAMSARLYEALGPVGLDRFFVDGTHQTDYGAYELAKCVVQGVIEAKLPLAGQVTGDWKGFDPAHPDAFSEFHLPEDPQLDPARPGGPGAPNGQGPMAGGIPKARATQPGTRP